jgi:hypothetical protein
MTRRKIVLAAPVVCDRCGETIQAGEEAYVTYNEKTGACKFEHVKCPGQHTEFLNRRPSPRNPRNLVRAAGRTNSNHNNRKVR